MILILVLALIIGWHSNLLAQTPFYQGKTITIAVGTKIAVGTNAGDKDRE